MSPNSRLWSEPGLTSPTVVVAKVVEVGIHRVEGQSQRARPKLRTNRSEVVNQTQVHSLAVAKVKAKAKLRASLLKTARRFYAGTF